MTRGNWNFTVDPVHVEDFGETVDRIDATKIVQPGSKTQEGVVAAVEAAKATMKLLATQIKREFVGGTAFGYCLQPGEDKFPDGIQVQCYGKSEAHSVTVAAERAARKGPPIRKPGEPGHKDNPEEPENA